MVDGRALRPSSGHGLGQTTISFLLTLSLISSHLFLPPVEGRLLLTVSVATQVKSTSNPPLQKREEAEKVMLGGRIGSRPPRCQGRCGSCGNCQAIQVPINPHNITSSSIAYARGSDYSDYKPISWKCKCRTTSLFHP